MNNNPIGVFDSGLGGLTVLDELIHQMPNESFIYFGDSARVPYGNKSKETIIKYSKQIADFLISKNVKMIVIACGTASSIAYDYLLSHVKVPVINVLEPISKAINSGNVGVIATKATIKSGAWKKQILKYNPDCKVYSKACPLFVPIVEEGLTNTDISRLAIEMYLKDFKSKKLDNIILGCTHYPILNNEIQNYLGKNIKVLNVNTYCAKEVKKELAHSKLSASSVNKPSIIAYTSDSASAFKSQANIFAEIKFDGVFKAGLEG